MPGRTIQTIRRLGALIAACLVAACERGGEPAHEAPAPPPAASCTVADDAGVVARVGGESVTATELDATMALRLHDLEMARYELRAARLRELLLARLFGPAAAADGLTVVEYVRREAAAAGLTDAAFVDAAFARAGVAIDLGPPEPPVIELAGGDDPVRGPTDAPVAIVVFCDFQSRYCRDMHPVLERLLAAYPTQVRLVARDFPLPVHRDAVTAAEAAACAGRQRAYWPYHDALLQDPGGLDRAALAARAHRVGIDVARLVACIDRREARADVEADAAEARRLGLSIVPTTFVDGRYLRGPQSYEALREQVDAALRRRGLAVPPPPAAIASGDQPGTAPAPPTSPPATQPGRVPSSSITLSAALVQRALADRPQLERDLDHPTADLGPGIGQRPLVRVGAVRAGTLYEAMGLEEGDVIMRVDGTLLLERGDALFDALGTRPTVTVQVLRHGLPQRLEYRIR